jgi:ferredoxin-NADP reductase
MGWSVAPGAEAGGRVLSAHRFVPLRVKRVIEETFDSRSFVFDVPASLSDEFSYRPGQFCTFRVHIDGRPLLRSYSMSSAPETDPDLTVTVKRVPGGAVSNWLVDRVEAGDKLEVTRPAGVFCLSQSTAPVVAFCGGSGVTPILSLAKSALASTARRVTILYANRDRRSVIFGTDLEVLSERHGPRLEVLWHFDSDSGLIDPASVAALAEREPEADFYICGPTPFMDMVESRLLVSAIRNGRIFIERFGAPPAPPPEPSAADHAGPSSITVIMDRRRRDIPYQPGSTVLETARRGALSPPFSCESGECATCMAVVRAGSVRMRVNNALTDEEVEEGWILTCQALPTSPDLVVEYEPL